MFIKVNVLNILYRCSVVLISENLSLLLQLTLSIFHTTFVKMSDKFKDEFRSDYLTDNQ